MKVLAENKKVYFNYEILEKLEAGISLIGQEVKSIKKGQINLKGAHVVIDQKPEAYLINAYIPPYQPKNAKNYNPTRARKLLLKKKEIKYLLGKSKEKGLTLLPLRVYTKDSLIKIEIGIGRIKRKVDKRETIKKKEFRREAKKAKEKIFKI
jgi:SsrA-binding protein